MYTCFPLPLDTVLELCQAPVGQIIHLDGDNYTVCTGEHIDLQDGELLQAAYQDEVILPPNRPQGPVKNLLLTGPGQQIHLHGRQVNN